MSTPPPDADESKDDALAALHGLGNSDESEHEDSPHEEDHQIKDAESREDATAESNASGFVGMLAKESAAGAPAPAPAPARSKPEGIRMARELSADELPKTLTPAYSGPRAKKPKPVPGWYHGAVPVMFTLGSVLLLIGFWAVGALIYMAITKATDAEPGYLWIHSMTDDDTGISAYTSGSKMMAIAMVVCLPVAIAMAIMGVMMRKQISAENRRAAK